MDDAVGRLRWPTSVITPRLVRHAGIWLLACCPQRAASVHLPTACGLCTCSQHAACALAHRVVAVDVRHVLRGSSQLAGGLALVPLRLKCLQGAAMHIKSLRASVLLYYSASCKPLLQNGSQYVCCSLASSAWHHQPGIISAPLLPAAAAPTSPCHSSVGSS